MVGTYHYLTTTTTTLKTYLSIGLYNHSPKSFFKQRLSILKIQGICGIFTHIYEFDSCESMCIFFLKKEAQRETSGNRNAELLWNPTYFSRGHILASQHDVDSTWKRALRARFAGKHTTKKVCYIYSTFEIGN